MNKPVRAARGKAIDSTNVISQIADVGLVQHRREQIVEAAVQLFSYQGFYKTTVQEVAQEAGMSIGSIYHYARTKEDILLLTLLSVLQSYKTEIPPALEGEADPIVRLWKVTVAYCRVVDARRAATVLAYRSTKSLPEKQQTMVKKAEIETNKYVSACVRACIKSGYFRKVNVEVLTTIFVVFAHSWALKHWRLKSVVSIDDFIKDGFDILFSGAATELGREHYKSVASQLRLD